MSNSEHLSSVAPIRLKKRGLTFDLKFFTIKSLAAAVSSGLENRVNHQLLTGDNFPTSQFIASTLVLFALILVWVGAFIQRRRARLHILNDRFGSGYDRAVLRFGSVHMAEAKPDDLETRGEALKTRGLGLTERRRFAAEWQTVESRFVDHPWTAVARADDLINALFEAHGYPFAGIEQRIAGDSGIHPHVMENYRAAHSIFVRRGQIEATAEELHAAMIQYREVFDELLQIPQPLGTRTAAYATLEDNGGNGPGQDLCNAQTLARTP